MAKATDHDRLAVLAPSSEQTIGRGATVPFRDGDSVSQPVLDLGPEPATRPAWLATMWDHRQVIYVLARKDFHVRYKRASFGVAWALAVPALQATVLIVVFSRLIRPIGHGVPYGAYVLSGIFPWTYLSTTLPPGSTSIVDGVGLTDKVWFPRAILPLIPCLSGLVGLMISMVLILIGAPLLGSPPTLSLLLLIPACLLLVMITMGICLVSSAMQVYFRDVRFIVGAAMMVWMYATPIMYPESAIGHLAKFTDLNPMTGVITLFHLAVVGQAASNRSWHWSVAFSVAVTAVLLAVGLEVQRRYDRVFVDLL
jgi:lipopolysaccharide transport system permease protein